MSHLPVKAYWRGGTHVQMKIPCITSDLQPWTIHVLNNSWNLFISERGLLPQIFALESMEEAKLMGLISALFYAMIVNLGVWKLQETFWNYLCRCRIGRPLNPNCGWSHCFDSGPVSSPSNVKYWCIFRLDRERQRLSCSELMLLVFYFIFVVVFRLMHYLMHRL